MSLRLTKPGMPAAIRLHPKTGKPVEPIGFIRGKAVWPVMGGAPDPEDPDDPHYTGGDDPDEEDDDEEDEPEPLQNRTSKKSTKSKKDEDEEDDDEDEDEGRSTRAHRAAQQAKRYRLALRDTQKQLADLKRSLEDKDKDPDEIVSRELSEAKGQIESLSELNRIQAAQLAFFKTPVKGVEWIDASDAFALAEREGLFDDVIDEDGNVDSAELRRGLRDLARRKKHLVKVQVDDKKARGRKSTDDDEDEEEEDDEEEPRSRRSASTMNSGRRGKRQAGPSKSELAKKFPVLNRL